MPPPLPGQARRLCTSALQLRCYAPCPTAHTPPPPAPPSPPADLISTQNPEGDEGLEVVSVVCGEGGGWGAACWSKISTVCLYRGQGFVFICRAPPAPTSAAAPARATWLPSLQHVATRTTHHHHAAAHPTSDTRAHGPLRMAPASAPNPAAYIPEPLNPYTPVARPQTLRYHAPPPSSPGGHPPAHQRQHGRLLCARQPRRPGLHVGLGRAAHEDARRQRPGGWW